MSQPTTNLQSILQDHFNGRDLVAVQSSVIHLFFGIIHTREPLELKAVNGCHEIVCMIEYLESLYESEIKE